MAEHAEINFCGAVGSSSNSFGNAVRGVEFNAVALPVIEGEGVDLKTLLAGPSETCG